MILASFNYFLDYGFLALNLSYHGNVKINRLIN